MRSGGRASACMSIIWLGSRCLSTLVDDVACELTDPVSHIVCVTRTRNIPRMYICTLLLIVRTSNAKWHDRATLLTSSPASIVITIPPLEPNSSGFANRDSGRGAGSHSVLIPFSCRDASIRSKSQRGTNRQLGCIWN